MTDRIMELARSLGQVDAQEEELLVTLCQAAQRELSGQLREGISPADCPEAFALAGAWYALAGLEVSRAAGQVQSFSAGDVTVHHGGGGEKAKLLRQQADRILSGWTRDDHFLFFGV